MNVRLLAIMVTVLSAAMLAACGNEAPKQAVASGEILPGSASDAMIPEDRLTSQPPLDPGAVRHASHADEVDEGTGAAMENGATQAPAAAESNAPE